MSFAEFEACVASGLDLWAWENNVYSKQFKVMVMAWHKLHDMIGANIEQAVTDKMRKKAR